MTSCQVVVECVLTGQVVVPSGTGPCEFMCTLFQVSHLPCGDAVQCYLPLDVLFSAAELVCILFVQSTFEVHCLMPATQSDQLLDYFSFQCSFMGLMKMLVEGLFL